LRHRKRQTGSAGDPKSVAGSTVSEIAIVRAAHLQVYLDEFRKIGVSVERALGGSWIEETPDAYVSIPLCLE
jgi:hypothetical protein